MKAIANALLVGLGGFVGSIMRYAVSGAVQTLSRSTRFPAGTLGVNVIGCLAIGLLAGWADNIQAFSPTTRLLVFVGFLGGFTTFSSFGHETMALFRDGEFWQALSNVGIQVIAGLAAVWLGYAVSTVR